MTAKKRWLNKIYHDSQSFFKNTQADISWSSSESEEETQGKKKKTEDTNSATNKWITFNLEQKIINQEIFLAKINSDIVKQSISSCQQTNRLANRVNLNSPSREIHVTHPHFNRYNEFLDPDNNIDASLRRYCESPIISNIKLEELSPVLVKTQDSINSATDASPVLGDKRRILKKIRSKYKRGRKVRKVDESSPDLFESQSTQVIDSDSPELKAFSVVEPTNSQSTVCIDPFPSQHSSQVINSDTDSSSSKKDNMLLYHQPAPKKKCYKKGGLASLLQKTLHLQRTRVAIWEHEMYTKKVDDFVKFEEGEVISFLVKHRWREYGSTLLECNLCTEGISISSVNGESSNFFLVIVGFSTNLNVVFDENSKYKLFPPYSIKTVDYKSRKVLCYFNVTKLIPLRDP